MGEQEKLEQYTRDRSGRAAGLSVTVLLHAVAMYALLQHHPVSSAITPARPLMVSFVTEPPAPKVAVPVAPPKPVERRVVRKAPQKPQAPTPAPLIAAETSDSIPVPPPPTEPERAPSSVPAAVSQASNPAPPAPAPVPVTQPSFSADYLQNPAPRYPPIARRMGQEGKVVLRVLVSVGGGPAQIEVRSSSGSDVLDEAALDAVRRWRFVPARRGDQPVAAWVLVPITFTLQG